MHHASHRAWVALDVRGERGSEMNQQEATQHGLGYAAGREDASGVRTADRGHSCRPGFIMFAEAYAAAWGDYNSEHAAESVLNRAMLAGMDYADSQP